MFQGVRKKSPQKGSGKTVQENMEAKVRDLLGEVDHAIDLWDTDKFDMYSYLTDNKVSSAVASKIPTHYTDLQLEIQDAILGTDPQLKEGYSFMNMSEKKGFLNFVTKIILDTDLSVGGNGHTYIFYAWGEVPGYSYFGKYHHVDTKHTIPHLPARMHLIPSRVRSIPSSSTPILVAARM